MYYTTFNPDISHLGNFHTIGYDPSAKILQILYNTGEKEMYDSIDEAVIFSLIISCDKEAFIRENLADAKVVKV